MASAEIRLTVNRKVILNELRSPSGGVTKDLIRRGTAVQRMAKRLCPRDKGKLVNSITLDVKPGEYARVGTNVEYARYVHEGTGNNGNGYIYPRRGRFLRFPGRGGGQVFAKRVRGVKGRPFLKDALPAARL